MQREELREYIENLVKKRDEELLIELDIIDWQIEYGDLPPYPCGTELAGDFFTYYNALRVRKAVKAELAQRKAERKAERKARRKAAKEVQLRTDENLLEFFISMGL